MVSVQPHHHNEDGDQAQGRVALEKLFQVIYLRGVAGGRASKDTATPVVKKNVALLTSCFDIVRPTTPKTARLGESESPAPPLTSIRSRARPSAVLSSSCSREYRLADRTGEPRGIGERDLQRSAPEYCAA